MLPHIEVGLDKKKKILESQCHDMIKVMLCHNMKMIEDKKVGVVTYKKSCHETF